MTRENKTWLLRTILAVLITTLVTGTGAYFTLVSVVAGKPTSEDMISADDKTRTDLKEWVLERETLQLQIVQQIADQLTELKSNQTTLRDEQVNIRLQNREFQAEFRTRMDTIESLLKRRQD